LQRSKKEKKRGGETREEAILPSPCPFCLERALRTRRGERGKKKEKKKGKGGRKKKNISLPCFIHLFPFSTSAGREGDERKGKKKKKKKRKGKRRADVPTFHF